MAIRLYWSRSKKGGINYGDALSPILIEHLTGKPVKYSPPDACDLVCIGSLMNNLCKVLKRKRLKRLLMLRLEKIRVWGTGSFGTEDISGSSNLAVFAVRGPRTRDALHLDDSVPLGDPGLLIDCFELKTEKKFRWGIIPHVKDRNMSVIQDMHKNTDHSCIIDLADPDVLGTARKIRACDFIISSSLHGLITADAFGIPNVWMRVSENVYGRDWKFLDYFSSVGRTETGPLNPTAAVLQSLEKTASRVEKSLIEKRQKDLETSFMKMGF